jgi:alpha-L-fucosidase
MDWETPATINDTWGFKRDDHNWKSQEELIRKLVDITSKGGAYLLNVGPTAEGVIPQPSMERLEAMGTWLETNGESIYATQPGPIQGVDWCRTTRREGTIYLHVFEWPQDGVIELPELPVRSAWLLADGARAPLSVQRKDGRVIVYAPAQPLDQADTVVVLEG